MGEGTVNISSLAYETNAHKVYRDMQIFKYKPKQAGKVKKMNVTVALIASGADGCSRAQPITPESCFTLTMDYLQAAGKMGIDLAVLPENWLVLYCYFCLIAVLFNYFICMPMFIVASQMRLRIIICSYFGVENCMYGYISCFRTA